MGCQVWNGEGIGRGGCHMWGWGTTAGEGGCHTVHRRQRGRKVTGGKRVVPQERRREHYNMSARYTVI